MPSKIQPSSKYTRFTLGFYLLTGALIYILNMYSPGGSCSPGPGIISLLLMPVISGILFIITCTLALMGRKTQVNPAIIHGIVLLGFGLLWLYVRHR